MIERREGEEETAGRREERREEGGEEREGIREEKRGERRGGD